jgi:hypothetical protein
MDYYAGIDVSLEQSSVRAADATGKIVCEAKVASEPEALVRFFGQLSVPVTLSAMIVKTDRKDARGIAHLLRIGWFRPVHRKSADAILLAMNQHFDKTEPRRVCWRLQILRDWSHDEQDIDEILL